MRQLYTLGIRIYTAGIRVAAHFGHQKARQMTRGWRTWRQAVEGIDPERPTAWFHASSLGEFEQARPVLEAYRSAHPDHQVLVTFFSPSGYEVRKNYPLADAICYLPPDTPKNVRALLDATRPDIAFFVKYDFWYNYLGELRRRNVATYLFSSIFRPGQYFFKPWGKWFLRQLGLCYRHLFVQNEESLQLLKAHGIAHCSLAGDTRYDRVQQIERLFPDSVRYSAIKDSKDPREFTDRKVLIIDNIGLLSKLYRYADVAYIGGGFGVGIHNILEAVAYGKPVVFGPNWNKFQEAHDILELGGGMTVDEHPDVSFLRKLFTDEEVYRAASDNCLELMQRNLGSTDIILKTIEK